MSLRLQGHRTHKIELHGPRYRFRFENPPPELFDNVFSAPFRPQPGLKYEKLGDQRALTQLVESTHRRGTRRPKFFILYT